MSASSVVGATRAAAGRGAHFRARAPSVPKRNPPPAAHPVAPRDLKRPDFRDSGGRGASLYRRPGQFVQPSLNHAQSSIGASSSAWPATSPSSPQFADAIPAPQSNNDARGKMRQPSLRPASPARVAGATRSEFTQAVLRNMNERHSTGGGSFNKHYRYKNGNNDHRSNADREWGSNNRRSGAKRHGRNRRSELSDEETAARTSARAAEIAAARARARQEWFEKSKAQADGGGHIQSLNMGVDAHVAKDGAHLDAEDDKKGPFSWGDLQAAVDQLPEGHWAAPYLRGVANSLHLNASLSPTRKRLMMQQVTTSLASVSQVDAVSKASASMPN